MLRYRFASPTMSRSYALKHFRADLKEYVRAAGGADAAPIVVFIEDHHLDDPAFLECLNSLLSAAELPGLFTAQEQVRAEDGRRAEDFFVERAGESLDEAYFRP